MTVRPLFLLTVDTEEEWDWNSDFPHPPFSTENIKAVPHLQHFCEKLEVIPTYFLDYAVAEKPENVDIFKPYFDRGLLDIGAHLHPWCTPPINEYISCDNSHAVNLGVDIFRQKMQSLTDLLQDEFGCHPFSFRSGRWGLNADLLKILAELGYKVDSSVRPFYEDLPHFSYMQALTHPYWPSFDNILLPGEQREILEIPASSGFNHVNFEFLNKLHASLSKAPVNKLRLIGILWQLGIMKKITVTPEAARAEDVNRCIDMAVKRGDVMINLFFHSSNLVPGNTDYVQTEADLKEFYAKLEKIIKHVRRQHGAEFVSIRQAHERLTGNNEHENYWDLTA
jgi:hypothetical protein